MWFWDFSPPSRWSAKPISKKKLKELQDNFKRADEISKQTRAKEQEDQKKVNAEIDNLLSDII